MLLSSISEKTAVSVRTAERLGKPVGVLLSPTNRKYVITDSMHIFALDNMFANGDIITVASVEAEMPRGLKINLGDEIYTVHGKRVGISKDVNMRGSGIVIYTDDRKIRGEKIVASADGIILINPKNRQPKVTISLPEPKDIITSPQGSLLISEVSAEPLKTETSDPADYSFMIGKRLKNEVADITRSFVLMAGTIITDRVIQNARRAGKLTDLYNNIN